MKKIVFFVCFCWVCMALSAQSMMWKVTGKNIKSPSYLYGTIHIQDQRVFDFDSTVWRAFGECQAFAGELDMERIDAKAVRESMVMPKGQTINVLLSKRDFALLDSVCKAKLGASVLFLNTTKPFFIMSAIGQTEFKKDKGEFLDIFFMKKAKEQNKSRYGLEEYIDQMKAIDAIKIDEQVKMLVDYLHDSTQSNAMNMSADTMLAEYLAFNIDKMVEMTADPTLPQKFAEVLINKRNVTMAKGFVKIAKKEKLFCAVGAGHLGGEKGIIALLRKKGYTVEPVVFQWVEPKTEN